MLDNLGARRQAAFARHAFCSERPPAADTFGRLKSRAKSNKPKGSARAPRVLTRGQRWTFRALAVLVPLLLLATVEIFLRLSGYGYPTGFFLKQRVNGRDLLTENRQFGWRFFPKDIARTPQPVMLAPRKEPGTTRIFVFGESAAMGDPEPAFGLPRLLQAMLELKFPSNRFEVINVAMTAINSHVVREIAKDCAPLEGDIWVVYMGNNEVVGPFGSGTIFGRQAPTLAFIRATLWLKNFRVMQLVDSLAERGPTEWGGMEMFLAHQVRFDDPRMANVYDHFARNLNEIVRIGSAAGARVILGTVPVNLRDCPPFASSHLTGARQAEAGFEKLFANGIQLAASNRFAEAHAAFSKMQDDGFAELYFHLARCELALGRPAEAGRKFERARDVDGLRFRADQMINGLIHGHAFTRRADETVVDAERELSSLSSNNIPGAEFFHEHVHFTFEGNYQLARIFLGAVLRALPAAMTNQAVAREPSMEDCARRLAWTDWDRLQVYEEVRRRLQQPPFTAQFGHAQRDAEWKRRIDELGASLTAEAFQRVTKQYRAAIRMAPGDWVLRENLAKLLEANGEPQRALEEWREVMRLLPHEILAHYHVGNLLDSLGRSEEALPFFREALRRNAASTETRNGLALALMNLGRNAEAEKELLLALRLKPKSTEARVNLGQLLAQQGRTNEAIAQYELALRHDTNSAAPHINLGKLLNQAGDKAGAKSHYEAAVRINPQSAVAHFNLGNALLAENPAEAARHYTEAVRVKPDFAEAHLALALELARRGESAEAERHFKEAIRLQPASVDGHFNYGVLLAQQRRFAEAAGEFSVTLKLQPNHLRAREFLQRAEAMK